MEKVWSFYDTISYRILSISSIFILSLRQIHGIIYLSLGDQLGGSNEKEIFGFGGFSFGSCCPRRLCTTWGGDSGADSFVGTWLYTSDNYSTIEFKTDGTFLWNNGGLEITGTYVVDGNEATLTSATYDGEPVVTTLGTATIDGNTLKFLGGEFIRQ